MVQEGQHVQIFWYVVALAKASRGDPIHMFIVLVISEGLENFAMSRIAGVQSCRTQLDSVREVVSIG
jgi:hypothetical protein